MDSYNLFGDDGSGMLDGLTDLGGGDSFTATPSSGVTNDAKDSTDSSYRQSYNQGNVAQEGSLQKLTSFGGSTNSGISSNAQSVPPPAGGPPGPEYHEYGNYPPRPRLPQPPHAPLHPSHHVHPSHPYPGYHPGPEAIYGITDHPGITDMGVWPGSATANRYSPITPVYRHTYEHQQKLHQYAPQQGAGIGSLQAQNGAYIPRQPHFAQTQSQQVYSQQQNYPNYTQMHPPSASRINHHPSYHQQMDVNPHQYGLSHGQSHSSMPQHQSHQNMGNHPGSIASSIQGHPGVHLHHSGPPLHHVPRQPVVSPSTATPSHPVPTQIAFAASPHHAVPMNYPPHQVQHPLDVNVSNQYNPPKPSGLETGSPQYRPPFPQLSPQISPRAQMSPRQQPQPQLSPRPVMSPVKGPNASPHSRNLVQPPVTAAQPPSGSFGSQNTLQALEQMVLPSGSYETYQRNTSPAVGHLVSAPSQWNQKIPTPINIATQIDHNVKNESSVSHEPSVLQPSKSQDSLKSVTKSILSMDNQGLEKELLDSEKSVDPSSKFLPTSNSNISKDANKIDALPIKVSQIPSADNCQKAHEKLTSNLTNESDLRALTAIDKEKSEEKSNTSTYSSQNADLTQLVDNQVSQGNKEHMNMTALPVSIAVENISPKNDTTQLNASHSNVNSITHSPVVSGNHFDNVQQQISTNRTQGFSTSIQNASPNVSNVVQVLPSVLPPNPPSNIGPVNASNSTASYSPGSTPGIQSLNTQSNVQALQHINLTSNNIATATHHAPQSTSGMPNSMPNLQNNVQPSISNIPPITNVQTNPSSNLQGLPVGISMAITNMHSNIGSSIPQIGQSNMINVSQSINPNNVMIMNPNAMPHSDIPPMFSASHHQERASLQQQIQDMYCLPPSNENQKKVRCLQERLVLIQQHETNEKCNGGPNCILQNSIYSSKMVESPQVTSTTGRGRGKGPAKPRKPRAKKEKVTAQTAIQNLDQLPVSEDCVTAGTGLQMSSEVETEINEDITNLDSTIASVDDTNTPNCKKQRGPRKTKERKPRTPKEPKTPKDNGEKPIKERKKREPKDPNAPKRRRTVKKDNNEVIADTTTNYEFLDKESIPKKNTEKINNPVSHLDSMPEVTNADDANVTDFDDIPVSRIAVKELMEEAEAKKEQVVNDDDADSIIHKRKPARKRSSGGSNRKLAVKRTPMSKRKRRGGIVPDSDGEPDDLVSTPPPSPPPEGDDSLKRRSARNTHRKKYTDDVVLRLSDDEFVVASTPKQEKESKHEEVSIDTKDGAKPDIAPKPNYMYVNTTEEDAMIVQHVIACRMGKRELKYEPSISETSLKLEKDDINMNEPGKDLIDHISVTNDCKQSEDINNKTEGIVESKELVSEEVQKQNIPDESKPAESKDQITEVKSKPVMVDVEEYFVKYRNFSFLHCEWKTEEELYKGDKRIFSKIKRFKQKQAQQMNIFELFDDEPFNPDYVEVERILDMSENQDPGNNTVVTHYLVKWKSLQYEDSTWELEEDVDIDKIKQYKIFNELPPKDKWKYKRRPSPEHWTQLKESPLYKGGNTLRPYQLEGLNWLLFSWHNNRNCILADEMGLGKTIQSLTFVNSVWEYGIRGPFLIIAPLSTIPNWQREFEAWTDMNVVVYHGSQQSKSMIQEYEFYYKSQKNETVKDITKFNVLITTFEIIVTDFQELKSFNWRICVIDEAHRLKNRNCKLLEGLRQLHLEHRVLLSGTPLQNNVNELFSLLNFLEPSQFSSSEAFLNEFGQLKSESEVLKLQALLKPMMLRRLKEDVEKTLAPKEETIIEVELTNIQKKYYRAILERNFSFLQKGTASAANIPNLMNTMMELRKCCIHPYLLNGAEDQIQFDYKQTYGEDKEAYYKALIQSSGKMVLVDKLLPKLKAGGHRVLIFSQMVRCLDILEDYLVFRKYAYERIDGRIRGNLRQEAIDRFSKPDSDRFVFLLCTKAGGLGINLTAADTVIIYDSDWNPQNDLQAQARCHRIGQQKMVKIYRLICRNTYEREMFDKASMKLGLDKAILQSMNTTQGKETGIRQLSKKEIEDLLKKGAYGAVMDEDNAGDKFCEEDIEMILARRTQVIQMESEKGSTFSKASFAATDQRSDIDIRDPDFWNKWAKKAEIDTTEKKEDEDLIVTEPRKRTIIKRYGHDDGPMEMSDMDVTPDSDEDEEGISLRSKRKKDKLGRKGRKYASDDYIPRHEGVPIDDEVVYGSWTRSECFKIERGLLTFGWARWEEILDKNQFRKGWTIPVIEDCARIIVLYCLRHYKGDEKIRNFIWDLIEPCENGEVTISRNHSGLHNPVPRGRNAKKKNRPKDLPKQSDIQKWDDVNHWCSNEKYDCEAYLESSYKKHLFRHANKVLLRVRMMYYIKHEVIGDYAIQIENGTHASSLGMRVPRGVDSAPPRLWWDTECDVSLLVGTYVHGYENYFAMRSDPQLCFVDKLGPPDDAECTDIRSEERKVRGSAVGDEDCTDDVSSGAGATSPAASPRPDDDSTQSSSSGHLWPSMQDLNTRLRRLITAYQRNYKREELKLQQRAKMERRERMEQLARDDVSQWRWTRADEEAFRRTVASYGVEFDPATKSLRWSRFRTLARLDSKSDDALTDYLKAFMAMCKRQCGLTVGEAELPTRVDLKAEPIGEERAIATLERIDLLRVLREEVAPHPALDARLALCERSPDTPPWWQPARHDKLLIMGVCKHGLGDTYQKLFCDTKLPFADCASKWLAKHCGLTKTEPQNSSDEEEKCSTGEPTRMSLRRSKRTSNVCDRDEDDTDALSELETLAKLGRIDESLSPEHWFSERSLETRLHHIAHAVQNCEWPSATNVSRVAEGERNASTDAADDRKHSQKRHIAIDVETERAKLHALLSSPAAAHASSAASAARDDASSDSGSRRSTPAPAPAPPPAHQRVAPSPAPPSAPAAPVDLSAPLDLSEVHDFSLARRTPPTTSAPSASAPSLSTRSRLDDTLSKLMKRKNVPAPEQVVGKEKKRKKLDEIVLGLSAAKSCGSSLNVSAETSRPASSSNLKSSAVLPDVTVTPAAPSNSSFASSTQKPFSVTVTNVTSPQGTTKELSSYLQQSLEQSKSQKSTSTKSYSHEAKVNKWLAEQATVDARRRGLTQRPAPDEHVPVVHRVTGKRIVGQKAPQLKHLAQWIAENPMYDIDPKWTEGIKEHVKLSQDVRGQRHSPMPSTSSVNERKKGRPPSLDVTSANVLSSSHLNQNLAGLNPALLASLSSLSAFDPKTLAATLSNLTSFDPKLLSTFDPKLLSSLSSMDPKSNPLLNSFGSMPNLLGNIPGGNLFANLAGLGLPGFSSLDMSNLGNVSNTSSDKSKSRKPSESSAASNSKSTSAQFPFVFPNPNMLYPQLGLGGLNPFGMHSGISSTYDALGLLSSNLTTSSAATTYSSHNSSRSSTKTTAARSSTVVTNSATSRQQKVAADRQHASHLPQILLPPDPYLLETLSKQNYDTIKTDKRGREENLEATDLSKNEKKSIQYDALRSHVPPEFAAVQEKLLKGDKKDIDISKMLLEQMASGALSASLVSAVETKKIKENEKDAYEKLNKSSSEYIARTLSTDNVSTSMIHKRTLDEISDDPHNYADLNPTKKMKDSITPDGVQNIERQTDSSNNTGEMDLEDLIAPSTVIKTGVKTNDFDPNIVKIPFVDTKSPSNATPSEKEDKNQQNLTSPYEFADNESMSNSDNLKNLNENKDKSCASEDTNIDEMPVSDGGRKVNKKKGRKSTEENIAGPRRELRSSAGRQSIESSTSNQ